MFTLHSVIERFSIVDLKGPFTQAIFVAQLNAIFVALKLQLENRAYDFSVILVQFIAAV